MSTTIDPIVSEFATQEEADAYDLWLRAKVEASTQLADNPATPRFTTDEVMRKMDQVIKLRASYTSLPPSCNA